MPQRVNLRESPFVFKSVKCFYAIAGFFHFALLVRLLILLPLVGRRFLPGGIHEFFRSVVLIISGVEFVLSILKLIPISPSGYVFSHLLPVITVCVFDKNIELQRHTFYGLYIADITFTGVVAYFYHYKKLSNLGRVPQWLVQVFQVVNVLEFPLHSVMEFAILFMGLKYVEGWAKHSIQLILLVFIPTKVQLYKRLLFKFFRIESTKVE